MKDIAASAEKWSTRSQNATEDYGKGIDNPKRSWADSSIKAEANYKTSVVAAANAGRFGNGVRRAGDAKWKENSKLKGKDRYTGGVMLAVAEWQRGYAPFAAGLGSVTLPDRGPRRSAQNYQRSTAMGQFFGQVKERLGSGAR